MGSAGNIGGKLTAGGGISGPQAALTQYGVGENLVGNAYQFQGLPESTGLTQADTGAQAGGALQAASLSNADAAALSQFFNQQFGQLSSGLGSLLGGGGGGGGGGTSSGTSSGGSGVG